MKIFKNVAFISCKTYLHSNSHRFQLYFQLTGMFISINNCQSDDKRRKRDYKSTVKNSSGAVTKKMYVIKKFFSISYRRNICGIVMSCFLRNCKNKTPLF